MAFNIQDFITKQVTSAMGSVDVPSAAKNQVLNGLTESILGSLTQTATKAGGIEQLKNLLTGKTAAASSPITALAGNMFNANILKKLNLGSLLNGKLAALVPAVMGGLSGILKDQDGDGDVDFQDIIITLKGGNKTQAQKTGGGLLGGLLGKILGGSR